MNTNSEQKFKTKSLNNLKSYKIMANKFFLEEKGRGKFKFYKVRTASGKKLRELIDSGVELFDTRKEAFDRAINLKKGN